MLILGLVALTWAAFAPSLSGAFLNWDDDRNFLDNPAYRGVGVAQFKWAWETYHLGVWQPLSWMLLGAQYALGEVLGVGGMNPAVYRCASLILHVANVVVFFLLVVTLIRCEQLTRPARAIPMYIGTSRTPLLPSMPPPAEGLSTGVYLCAAAAAALFAVHPLRVEAVSWTSCQPYLPAALFYILAVLAYVRYVQSTRRVTAGVWFAAVLACYLLAIASKAVAVSLPVVLLILDVYPLRRWDGGITASGGRSRFKLPPGQGRGLQASRGRRLQASRGFAALRLLAEKLPFILVAIVVSAWAASAKDYSDTRVPFDAADLDARLAQSMYGLLFYLIKTITPTDLRAYYSLPADLSLGVWRYGLAGASATALTLSLIVLSVVSRRWRPPLAAWLAYVVILLPNLGLVQISQQIAADRYSYLAVMPVMILFAGGLLRLAQLLRNRPRPTLVVPAAALCIAIGLVTWTTRRQTRVWNDSAALWSAVLALDPDCTVADCNLGAALLDQGKLAEASRHLSRAIERDDDFAWAYSNFGVILLQAGRHEDAATAFEQALAVRPPLRDLDRAKTHAGLGEAYANLRHYDLAWQHTLRAKELGYSQAEKMIEYLRTVSDRPSDQPPN